LQQKDLLYTYVVRNFVNLNCPLGSYCRKTETSSYFFLRFHSETKCWCSNFVLCDSHNY